VLVKAWDGLVQDNEIRHPIAGQVEKSSRSARQLDIRPRRYEFHRRKLGRAIGKRTEIPVVIPRP